MRVFKCEEKRKIYKAITNCSTYAKEKKNFNKTKDIDIIHFTTIVNWINSLSICKDILNIYNFYEKVKDGLILLKLIKIYQPEYEITGIFLKPIKKKCALINLEKALAVIYQNNPYYYSLASATDIYEKKEKKIHFLFLYLFDKYEFQYLKKNSNQLLQWYNHTLKKLNVPISKQVLNDPLGISNTKQKPINFTPFDLAKKTTIQNKLKTKDESLDDTKEGIRTNRIQTMWPKSWQAPDSGCNNRHKDILLKKTNVLKNPYISIQETEQKKTNIQTFTNYLLYVNKTLVSDEVPPIYEMFSDSIRLLLIFYRYGYLSDNEISDIRTGEDGEHRHNNFMLQRLLRKLQIPVVCIGTNWGEPVQISILLQLKYIQCYIHMNKYEHARDIRKTKEFVLNLLKIKRIYQSSSSGSDLSELSYINSLNLFRTIYEQNKISTNPLLKKNRKEKKSNSINISLTDPYDLSTNKEHPLLCNFPNRKKKKNSFSNISIETLTNNTPADKKNLLLRLTQKKKNRHNKIRSVQNSFNSSFSDSSSEDLQNKYTNNFSSIFTDADISSVVSSNLDTVVSRDLERLVSSEIDSVVNSDLESSRSSDYKRIKRDKKRHMEKLNNTRLAVGNNNCINGNENNETNSDICKYMRKYIYQVKPEKKKIYLLKQLNRIIQINRPIKMNQKEQVKNHKALSKCKSRKQSKENHKKKREQQLQDANKKNCEPYKIEESYKKNKKNMQTGKKTNKNKAKALSVTPLENICNKSREKKSSNSVSKNSEGWENSTERNKNKMDKKNY